MPLPIKKILPVVALTVATSLTSLPAIAADQIHVVGSSTVFPFVTVAAEQFGKAGKFKTPIVESTGTGGGFKLFCAGAGDDTPDLSDASRPITDEEKATCKTNGVESVTEIPIGFDGIVLAASKKAAPLNLTKREIFLALAREIPLNGKLVGNPYTRWKEINPALPDSVIQVYGPPPTSGTRDAFAEMAMEEACKEFPEFKAAYPDDKDRKKHCGMIREDGKYVESGEDDNVIVQKLVGDPTALGIFGYSYLEENKATIQGMKLDGVMPTFENISDGKYKLSRTLYVYVKDAHVGKTPGLGEFIQTLTTDAAMGPTGYMAAKGLIPLPDKGRMQARASAASALKPAH
jgi:phosphate transport system substrate-binding protein